MQNAQEVYSRIRQTSKEIKKIKGQLKEQYMQIPEYLTVQQELKGKRKQRRMLQLSVDEKNPDLIMRLNDLKIDLSSDKELLNDVVLSAVMRGETVEFEDEKGDQLLLPIFSVTVKAQ